MLTVTEMVKTFPLSWNSKVLYRQELAIRPYSGPVESNPEHHAGMSKIHFNIIFLCAPKSPKWCSPHILRSKFLCTSHSLWYIYWGAIYTKHFLFHKILVTSKNIQIKS